MYTPATSSLRFIEPKVEIYAQDRRSGAYPTKARTGDSTRSGKNKFYFDDTRTVLYPAGTSISLPTTLQSDSTHLASDMESDFTVVGDVKAHALDQWISHRDQTESLGPFNEAYLFEQDEANVVNSAFMTGAAFTVASDRFKSKLSNKTIIRMKFTLTTASFLSQLSSSLHYLNPTSGAFVKVADEVSVNIISGTFPGTFAALPFTPYGFHYLPLNDHISQTTPTVVTPLPRNADLAYARISSYAGDASDEPFHLANTGNVTTSMTASVINSRHAATSAQTIELSQYLSHPFLLEKMVVEFPFAAGPGWLNDRFGIRQVYQADNRRSMDAGGPLITFAVMRQNKSGDPTRELLASGTITTALDMLTGSYNIFTASSAAYGTNVSITPEGVGHFLNVNAIITGSSSPSGSSNFYTGSVKMILDPQVTSHVWRIRGSGSINLYYGNYIYGDLGVNKSHLEQAMGITFSPFNRSSNKFVQSGRNVLGNQLALINTDTLSAITNPVDGLDQQYENLEASFAPEILKTKIFHDVVSKTAKSPYLLYPEDNLVLALSKHRAVASPAAADWNFSAGNFPRPSRLVTSHDVQIPTGTFYLTLYGDLIKEDREFHDTLNQRLETVEIWETIGEEPVLDQFDISYISELSGSYIDRFNVFNTVNSSLQANLSSSRETQQYYSNFTNVTSEGAWSRQYVWSRAKRVQELQKSARVGIHQSISEIFWDTRILNPGELVYQLNPELVLAGLDTGAGMIRYAMTTGTEFWGPDMAGSIYTVNGIKDWGMRFPYESRTPVVTQQFSDTLATHVFRYKLPGVATIARSVVDYNDLTYEVGSGSFKLFGGEASPTSYNVNGMRKSEFLKAFFGIGTGRSPIDNQHVTYLTNAFATFGSSPVNAGVCLRGWRYGMMSAFPAYNTVMYRRDRYGQFRDMLEQRLDGKFFDNDALSVREAPVQVKFYDRDGNLTDAELTLSSNLSYEVTSSLPYFDGVSRNRGAINYSDLNISSVVF